MKSKSPCLDCKNRYPACHSTCEIGKAYSKSLEEERALIRAIRSQERTYNEYKSRRIFETKKKYGIE
ncbi:hypothetical protein [Sinanaerobacter chloroacetimidivorans]|jgi:hypothetical protein|uniref:Uncharacterized protein n=1 Tax=Sinanaerobacter chloroacetimidivorans TaxID=2818044 RepID=A0A8J7W059_9FIRM|nr:hypothetical protein [Sinanaerobacter chloroacetimidivorans]MBR0598352.1 hypothetical protein [Sinanaerobacter chloroacetimidivorans]